MFGGGARFGGWVVIFYFLLLILPRLVVVDVERGYLCKSAFTTLFFLDFPPNLGGWKLWATERKFSPEFSFLPIFLILPNSKKYYFLPYFPPYIFHPLYSHLKQTVLKTTHFHTQLITQLPPFFLSQKKKNWDTLFYFTVNTFITSEKIEEREEEKERRTEREGEGRWRSSVAGRKKPAEIGVHQAAPRPSLHRQTGSDRLYFSFFFSYFLVLIQLCCYNKK